ncbi:hypothetical protein OIO90_002734 [Microbotryomycetes sp. JL221]|nr:hypothetical protein OIO90_002734 [Microbotryomycetes sp. JL221]
MPPPPRPVRKPKYQDFLSDDSESESDSPPRRSNSSRTASARASPTSVPLPPSRQGNYHDETMFDSDTDSNDDERVGRQRHATVARSHDDISTDSDDSIDEEKRIGREIDQQQSARASSTRHKKKPRTMRSGMQGFEPIASQQSPVRQGCSPAIAATVIVLKWPPFAQDSTFNNLNDGPSENTMSSVIDTFAGMNDVTTALSETSIAASSSTTTGVNSDDSASASATSDLSNTNTAQPTASATHTQKDKTDTAVGDITQTGDSMRTVTTTDAQGKPTITIIKIDEHDKNTKTEQPVGEITLAVECEPGQDNCPKQKLRKRSVNMAVPTAMVYTSVI